MVLDLLTVEFDRIARAFDKPGATKVKISKTFSKTGFSMLVFLTKTNFYKKNKLKSEIFDDKKIYKQKCFSFIAENSNQENLTKNLVTFKM